MKAYGVRKRDAGCCSGHDKHPPPKLRSVNKKGSYFRRIDRCRKKRERFISKNTNPDETYWNCTIFHRMVPTNSSICCNHSAIGTIRS